MKTKQLIHGEWQLLLFGFLMTFFSIPGQTVFISLFSGEIRSELDLSHGEFSFIYSFATLCSAFVLVWTGTLTDKWPLRRLSVVITLALALASFGMSLVTGSILLFIIFFLLRQFGQGLMTLCGITALVRYLPGARGRSSALGNMGYTLAEAIMPATVVVMMLLMGWRNTWLIMAAVLVLIMIPAIMMLLKSHQQRHSKYQASMEAGEGQNMDKLDNSKQWRRSQVLRHPGFYLVVPAIMGHSFIFTGLTFHQIHLLEVKGWDLTTWASLFFMYSLVSVSSTLLSGWLIDRFRALYILPVSPVFLAAGMIFLYLATNISMAAVALFCIGISSGATAASSAPFWVEVYGSKHLGAIKSLAYSLVVFFSSISPVVIGVLLDLGISIEALTLGGAGYAALTLLLLAYASFFFRDHDK